jgi:RNA polymerase sigma-70 factor (ECF subfamily)
LPSIAPYQPPDDIPSLQDEELARVIAADEAQRNGNAYAAFEELHVRYTKLLTAYVAARFPARDAEDALQQIWMKVWNKAAQFRGDKFQAWLYQIARNTMIDWHRRRKDTSTLDDDQVTSNSDPAEPLLDRERMQALKDCMGTLSDREANILRQLLAGETYEHICTQLEINSNIAYKSARTAKTKLRTCVEHKLA